MKLEAEIKDAGRDIHIQAGLLKELNGYQRQRLHDYVKISLEKLEHDLEQSRWAKMRTYRKYKKGDYSDRRKPGSTFAESNLSMDLVRSSAKFVVDKCIDDVFGTRPWFAITPAPKPGQDPEKLAEAMQQFAEYNEDKNDCPFERASCRAIEEAVDLGYSVLKTVRRDEFSHYWEGGELITDAKYTGANTSQVDFEDFLFPVLAPDIQKAHMVGHKYKRRLSDLAADYFKGDDQSHMALWDKLQLAAETNRFTPAMGGSDMPRSENYENADAAQNLNEDDPEVDVVEVYFDYNLFYTPMRARQIPSEKERLSYRLHAVFIGGAVQEVIFLDYIQNVTMDGCYPFHMVTINRVPNRSYGVGFFEAYEKRQDVIDMFLNQIRLRNEYAAQPVIGRKRRMLDSTSHPGGFPAIKPGTQLDLADDATDIKSAMSVMMIPDLEETTFQLIDLLMQQLQNEVGVSAAAQGDLGAQPSMGTATGVTAILNSGNTRHKAILKQITDSLRPCFTYYLRYMFDAMAQSSDYLAGGEGGMVIQTMNREIVENTSFFVRITLTKFLNTQKVQNAQMMIVVVKAYVELLSINPEVALQCRRAFVTALGGLELPDADTLLPDKAQVENAMAEQAAAAQQPALPGPPPETALPPPAPPLPATLPQAPAEMIP